MRKERSDKKRAINPTVNMDFYDTLARLSYVCDRPLKDIGETLCMMGLRSKVVIDSLGKRFRRDYWFSDAVFIKGDGGRQTYHITAGPEKQRINLRFRKEIFEKISELSYALDTTVSKGTVQLLEESLHTKKVLGDLLVRFVQEDLDPQRMSNLRRILRYINRSNPNSDSDITLGTLLGYLMEAIGNKTRRITDVVEEWLENM